MVEGKTLKYTTTAGYIVLKEEKGKPLVKGPDQQPPPEAKEAKEKEANKTKDGLKAKAKVFFVAYTLDDAGDLSSRPLTFAFNGGPGSASGWLSIGGAGARPADPPSHGSG